ncbi:bifunctional diguanylate cyclase/phosphodiesterase [Roseicella aquatilis]|uniref:EAL domain-containing protein n=1 Tax=Roseicella aquatilis TaxID=2527868 RepID=A0A4R4DIE4_9PROT|nr:EAL domain-containing protein [Roseicella aquatilis]TCZ60885.1 EAL domain-containing protein [Roseicella aquatilis]
MSARAGLSPLRRPGGRLALGGALLGLLVMAGAGLIGWNAHDRALAGTGRELRNLSVVLADHADRTLQAVEILQAALIERMRSRGVTSLAALRAWAPTEDVHELLKERIAGVPQLDAVTIVDAEGRLLNFSRYHPVPEINLADRDYFHALRNGAERFIGRPVRNRGSGTWTIYIARRLDDAEGRFMGMVLGAFELGHFERFFGSLALGPDGSIGMLRADGILLARHPHAERAIGRDYGDAEAFRLATSRPDGTPLRVTSAIDGQERLLAARQLSAYPLRIHVGTTVQAALAEWRRQMLWLGGATAMLLALIAAATGTGLRKARAEQAAAEARWRGEQELAAQHVKFRIAVEGMSQGLWKFNAAGRLELTNRRCTTIIGMPREVLRPGANLAELRAGAGNATPVLDRLAEMVQAGQPGGFLHDAGDGRAASVRYQPLPDGGWIATFEDISERRAAEARIAHLTRHDVLTGLPNRAGLQVKFQEMLAAARSNGGQLAVLHLDLDRFKTVNDTLGHAAGDALLRVATARMQRNIRSRRRGGNLLARLGADEFVVLVAPPPSPMRDVAADAAAMARRLIDQLSEPFQLAGQEVVIGASAGVALYPRDGATPEALLQHADQALDIAKHEARGRVCFFDPGMDARAQARRQLERDMRRALMTAPEEFELHYQPVVEVATRRPTGFEALIRWRHPERGLVLPVEFIPLAEEMGLIVELGALALRRACAEAAGWVRPLRIAVNLSPAQFRSPRLIETVTAALSDNGLAPERLELEITEGVLLHDTEATMATLRRLKALGVRISMDDFGTGYSSLSYLRNFPFDKVKIDRAFVRDLETRSDDAAIVQAVTGLCERLAMTSTAEGVETEAQFRLLAGERCTEAQGYLFSRPIPASGIPALLARLALEAETAAAAAAAE